MELSGDPKAAPEEAAACVRDLCLRLSTPPLRTYGVGQDHIAELVARASAASSLKGNPIVLTRDELESLILSAI